LVVDDDPGVRKFFCDAAEHLGVDVMSAEDGYAFKKVYAGFNPSIVLVDMFMPGPDGFDLINFLGEQHCRSGLILVSGYDRLYLKSAKDIAEKLDFRSVTILTKPVAFESLKSAILSA